MSIDSMLLTLFTNDAELARQADMAGVDRIGVDLESIGKKARQGHLNTWISDHTIGDIPAVKSALQHAKLFARTNPVHKDLKQEIDALIDYGVEVLMLPYFHTIEEASEFIRLVDGRAEVSLLVETAAAALRLPELIKLEGIHDIHIGLNDLHLSLKLSSHFELLQSAFMKHLTDQLHEAGILFGFGGIARYHDDTLPIPSDLVYAQYAYHKAHAALVSRVFTSTATAPLDLTDEVAKARERIDFWFSCSEETLSLQHEKLTEIVHGMLNTKKR